MPLWVRVLYHWAIEICYQWILSDLVFYLGRPRHADPVKGVKNYQGPTTSRESAIRKYRNFPYTIFFLNFNLIMTYILVASVLETSVKAVY